MVNLQEFYRDKVAQMLSDTSKERAYVLVGSYHNEDIGFTHAFYFLYLPGPSKQLCFDIPQDGHFDLEFAETIGRKFGDTMREFGVKRCEVINGLRISNRQILHTAPLTEIVLKSFKKATIAK